MPASVHIMVTNSPASPSRVVLTAGSPVLIGAGVGGRFSVGGHTIPSKRSPAASSTPVSAGGEILSGAGAPKTESGALPSDQPAGSARQDLVGRALALAADRNQGVVAPSGEGVSEHAWGTVEILRDVYADVPSQCAAAMFGSYARIGLDEIRREFGDETVALVDAMRKVHSLRSLHFKVSGQADSEQTETLRRMLLAMASDIRVVLIALASRVQTLRWHVQSATKPEDGVANQTLKVLAPLANRLGLWQLKWELEDLAFRFDAPKVYRQLASELEGKRHEREEFVHQAALQVRELLAGAGIRAQVSGRPKHLYSIWNKMRSKERSLDGIRDLRGLRIIVDEVRDCYAALALIHERWQPVPEEFDDYIVRPKPNGYQSLHTVVLADDGRFLEVQIRTEDMHQFAEYGVASHWRYKERSAGGSAGRAPQGGQDELIAWIRQLLAWQREVGEELGAGGAASAMPNEHIYVLTPQARVVELPVGATPVDFAYHVHTNLGHRCRGARVDGQMVPLNTPLANGQTVQIISAKSTSASDGPSRDWLNSQLGYVQSNRARSKVRQWFNAQELQGALTTGRERVERALQREGRTALAFEQIANRLGVSDVEAMFTSVARDEIGPRQLEEAIRSVGKPQADDSEQAQAEVGDQAARAAIERASTAPRRSDSDGVLVVGVDLLMTQLARCCRPVPPDPIIGFVTRGRGVSVHRAGCPAFGRMAAAAPERVLETDWGERSSRSAERSRGYAVDVQVRANDRPGLLRDVTEVFARDKLNVTAVKTMSKQQVAQMQFTVEVPDASSLTKVLNAIGEVSGVFEVRRR
jgi:GTP pyrophosphokinase